MKPPVCVYIAEGEALWRIRLTVGRVQAGMLTLPPREAAVLLDALPKEHQHVVTRRTLATPPAFLRAENLGGTSGNGRCMPNAPAL